jgi:hypothetical protein
MKLAFLFLAVTLLVGCATTYFAPSKVAQKYPVRTSPDAIELYRSEMPTHKFSEIGSVSVCCGGSDWSINQLRGKASAEGGDALVGLDVLADGRYNATVIRYQ